MNEKIKIASIELSSDANNVANIMMADKHHIIFYKIVPTRVIIIITNYSTIKKTNRTFDFNSNLKKKMKCSMKYFMKSNNKMF